MEKSLGVTLALRSNHSWRRLHDIWSKLSTASILCNSSSHCKYGNVPLRLLGQHSSEIGLHK